MKGQTGAWGSGADSQPGSAVRMRAWDGPTRVYHWTQLLLVCGAYYTQWLMSPYADPTMFWHRWCGYGVLTLLVFRLLWGFAGSATARFSSFVHSPRVVASYLAQLARGTPPKYLGHNPIGTLMVVALLVVLAAQAMTGLFTSDSNSIFGGPFGHFDMLEDSPQWKTSLQSWHHLGANVLLGLIGVHVLVNLYWQFVKRDRLITAMVTGFKPVADYVDAPAQASQGRASVMAKGGQGGYLRALLCLAIAMLVVFGGVMLAGGRL